MAVEGVDVWQVGVSGSVDLRVSQARFKEMKGKLPGCREQGSVEELVRQAEMLVTRQPVNRTQQDWFENYVSSLYHL